MTILQHSVSMQHKDSFLNKIIIVTILAFLISGCNNSSYTSQQSPNLFKNQGTAQLGNLAGALVRIFEIDEHGKKILKWKEKTSKGWKLEEIGRFNLHLEELNPDKFYLYKVKGGRDWDIDDDGIKDHQPTKNRGIIRAIAKGSDILKAEGEFRVTLVSEIIFEKVAEVLKYDFNYTTFSDILKREAASVIEDIDENGEIDNSDVIRFHPVKKRKRLKKHYREQLKKMLINIHHGSSAIKIPYTIITRVAKVGFAHKLTLSKDETKVYIAGGKKGFFSADIKDAVKPTVKNIHLSPSSIVLDVALSGDATKAYLLTRKHGLLIVDMNNTTFASLASYALDGIPRKIILSKDESKAYIVIGSKGLVIIDISDPENPLLLGSYHSKRGSFLDIALSKDETKAYIANGKRGLKIIDVSYPTDPLPISAYKKLGGRAKSIALSKDETKAYILTEDKGLKIVDISTIDAPSLIGSCDIKGKPVSITLSHDETKAYIANGKNGLTIVDINSSANPTVVASVSHKKLSPRHILLSHDGSRAYIANGKMGIAILSLEK